MFEKSKWKKTKTKKNSKSNKFFSGWSDNRNISLFLFQNVKPDQNMKKFHLIKLTQNKEIDDIYLFMRVIIKVYVFICQTARQYILFGLFQNQNLLQLQNSEVLEEFCPNFFLKWFQFVQALLSSLGFSQGLVLDAGPFCCRSATVFGIVVLLVPVLL